MIGDRLVITEYHRAAAARVMDAVRQRLDSGDRPIAVTVAGESGSGKSETAHCLASLLEEEGREAVVLSQDDYFRLPPKTNHARRLEDIEWVGPGEVRLDLLDAHVAALKTRPGEPLEKPLVHFEDDHVGSEVLRPRDVDVVIAEGTYTSLLEHADLRAFIDRNYRQTKKARLKRGRDPDVDFLEKVLEIEHQEISRHKARADVVIPPPPEEAD